MPSNRGGPFIHAAVASVRAQTTPVDEIIIVDDGSPAPGLAGLGASLGVTCVRQPPSGISVARNLGVARASGEWIAFLDDDDVWHPERIAEQLQALQRRPDVVAVSSGGWYMDAEGRPTGAGWPSSEAPARAMLSGEVDFPRITTLLIRREAYLSAGACVRQMEPAEDSDLILRLLQAGEIAAVERPLVGYRRHDANVTGGRSLRGRAASARVIRRHLRRARALRDDEMAGLLRSNLAAFRRRAAHENLLDLGRALRAHEWGYATRVIAWGTATAPGDSLREIVRRVRRR